MRIPHQASPEKERPAIRRASSFTPAANAYLFGRGAKMKSAAVIWAVVMSLPFALTRIVPVP